MTQQEWPTPQDYPRDDPDAGNGSDHAGRSRQRRRGRATLHLGTSYSVPRIALAVLKAFDEDGSLWRFDVKGLVPL